MFVCVCVCLSVCARVHESSAKENWLKLVATAFSFFFSFYLSGPTVSPTADEPIKSSLLSLSLSLSLSPSPLSLSSPSLFITPSIPTRRDDLSRDCRKPEGGLAL